MTMKITLIQPLMQMRPMDTTLKTRMAPSLGLYTVASVVRDGNELSFFNENVEEIDFDRPADIVGITVTVDTLPRAIEIARKYRSRGLPVVAGGIQITSCPGSARGYFDALSIGFAEGTWPDILRDLEAGCLKPEYRCTRLQPHEIVGPAYDLIDSGKYLYVNVVSTSRGCPFKCNFCYNSCTNIRNSYVNRPIADVVDEIRRLNRRHIMFIDDNLIGNPAWTREFLEAIRPLNLKWQGAVSANVADIPGMLDLMRDTGCTSLFIGLESLSQKSIDLSSKHQNSIAKYERLVAEIHKRGIMVNASFVFGLDGDTPETFRHTVDWIVRNKIETVTSHILTPYPGTQQHAELRDCGRITSNDQKLYTTSHVVFRPVGMTPEQLYEGYLNVYREVYSLRNIIRRMPSANRAAYLMFNLFYRKFGRLTESLCRLFGYRRIGRAVERITRLGRALTQSTYYGLTRRAHFLTHAEGEEGVQSKDLLMNNV